MAEFYRRRTITVGLPWYYRKHLISLVDMKEIKDLDEGVLQAIKEFLERRGFRCDSEDDEIQNKISEEFESQLRKTIETMVQLLELMKKKRS